MNTTRTPRRLRPVASVLVGTLVSGLALVGIASPAAAATGDVSSASLDWGVKSSWRGYVAAFGGTATASQGASTDPAYRWSTSGTGTYDEASGAASVSFGGAVEWKVPAHGIDIVLSDPELDLASDGSGTLSFDYVDPTGASGSGVFATLSTAGATVTDDGGVASFSGVSATAAAAMTSVFGASYPVGTALDAVSFSLPHELAPVASATSTVLSASPSGSSVEGAEVVFTATVSPAADGQVQFFDGTTALGDAVATSAGAAELRTSGLSVGDHSITAEFTPADSSLHLGSTSEPLTQTVTAVPGVPDAPTTTTLAVTPAAPVVAGTASSLAATVASADGTPTGSVEFFSIAAGQTARVSLGTAPVSGGVATLPSTLGAGGHTFAAVFTPAGAFESSEVVTTANYGVVDTADAASCAPGSSARTLEGVSARWSYNAYSTDWVKSSSGSIAVDGQDFVLSDGVASYDADCTVIEFSGSLRVLAYPTMGGFWIDLANPTLAIAADGSGTWSADVTTVSNPTSQRLVITTVSGADVDLSESGEADLALDYASTTEQGTWSAAYSDAWSNGFVLNAPSSIRSFYYKSGETPGNLRKAPAAISLAWTVVPAVDAATSTVLTVSPTAPVVSGASTTFTATVASADATPTGSVEFFSIAAGQSDRVSLGSATVTGGVATLSKALPAGGHTFAAVFTSADPFATSEGLTTANYGVVDTADAASCTPGSSARTVEGVSATWSYNDYSTDWVKTATGDITVDGQDFVLAGGTATVDADCVVIQFSGSFRVAAYPTMGNFWIDLANPTLSIAADGSGTWSADVTTVANATSQRLVVTTVTGAGFPDFSKSGEADVALDYASTTEQGTWSAAYSDAWSNGFVLNAPSSIRSFYYKSGETPGNLRKAPAAISLTWTAAEPEQPTEPSEDGDLVWGFKSSWRSYLTVFGGTTTASNGASVNSDGLFVFTQADTGDYDATTGVGTIDYQGAVRFVNPSHGFDIAFANPTVTFDGTGSAVLSAETSTNDTAGLTSLSRVDLAVLDLPTPVGTDPITWSAVPATFKPVLQPEGWNQYAGQAADPVTFSYGASVVPPVDQPTLTVAGSTTVKQGETLTVQGSGFVPGQQLAAVVHSEPVTLPSIVVPASGAFTISWAVPADFETGAHRLDVTGPDGTVSIAFTVDAATVVPAGTEVTPAAQPTCVARSVSGATLNWGVKESFRSYIVGPIAKGSISTSGVADNGSSFGWSGGSGSVNATDLLGRVAFSGSVHFTGHSGQLDLTVSNPRIQLSGPNSASLIADLSSKELSGGVVNVSAAIATLSLSAGSASTTDGALSWSGVPATLTAAGASAFGGFYSAGAALDPVSFSLPLGATTACDSSTDGALAKTGVDGSGTAGEFVIALMLLLSGAAFVIARRRNTVRNQG